MADAHTTTVAARPPSRFATLQQLAQRGPWSAKAIEKMIERGELRRGEHFHQDPTKRNAKRYFDLDAIDEYITALSQRGGAPRRIHVPAAKRKLRQMLG